MLLYTGQTVQNVSEDQFVFLIDSEFTRPKISELLEIKKKQTKKMEMLAGFYVWGKLFFLNAPQKQNLINAIYFLPW